MTFQTQSFGSAAGESALEPSPSIARKLLVVDDEPAIARLIQKVAVSCGYSVSITNNSEEFTEALISAQPSAIVMDLSMPDVDGVELLRFLGFTKCRVPILIISGFDPRVLDTAANLGTELGLNITAALGKPVRVAALKEALLNLPAANVS